MKWKHCTVTESLPGNRWGTGGIGLADFTGNGILDIAVSRRETKTAYWFERINDETWVRHIIGKSAQLENTLGAACLDIDGDGWPDIAFSRVWFRNPGNLNENPDAPWEEHTYDGGGHDIVAADINSDGVKDLITYDGHVLAWFDVSKNMRKTVIADELEDHGGVAPKGIGDLNGNGSLDVVIPGFWFENPGNGCGDWKRHDWPYEPISGASYGQSIRSWIADINGSGWNDIIYSDCDTGFSHVYWVENLDGGANWTRHRLPDPPANDETGSFHSLGVADFDGDGNLDIFAGEQEDASASVFTEKGLLPMKPDGLRERGVIWMSSGGPHPTFEPVVFHEGRPGWHDAVLGDVDGNGAIDIVTKVWNTDWNTGEKNYHVDYWKNQILPK